MFQITRLDGRILLALAGWIDGDSAGGRMKVESRADGHWAATRNP